ncbi:hypothetical protein Leryth_018194 [Lithospermum erythrorhizon]|nr:hypothetical protein Leryth_018194 [Lithospermum erythrorhizon]
MCTLLSQKLKLNMMLHCSISKDSSHVSSIGLRQIGGTTLNLHFLGRGANCYVSLNEKEANFLIRVRRETTATHVHHQNGQTRAISQSNEKQCKIRVQATGKKEHHLWNKRDFAGSGQKALHLVHIISGLPSEKEAVYSGLDKWVAWETEFPLVAAAKALRILRRRNQWTRVIQVAKWMLSKGQGATMGTYDILLHAFDMEERVDEAEKLWNMILHTNTRSVSRLLFSRMISLYDHHGLPEKLIQVFADMEELGVKPDEDTLKRIAAAFMALGQEDKKKMVLRKYQSRWKYIHFKGERVRVRNDIWDD